MSFKKKLINNTALITGLLLIINLFSFLGEYHFIFELLTHFRLQYLVLFLFSCLFFIIFFNKKWLLLSLFGLIFNATSVLPIYFSTEVNNTEKNNEVSLMLTNVLTSNKSYAKLLNEIELKQADIIVVLELGYQWANELRVIDNKYPYQELIPRTDNFGIGLYSKYPLDNIRVMDFASNGVPSITASIRIHRKDLNIIATHPIPPMEKSTAEQQKTHLENLAHYVLSKKGKTQSIDSKLILVAGDLNSTPWSPRYRKLMKRSGLKNTRQGKGIYPSWPADGIIGYLMQIPLDHILVTKSIHTRKFEKLGSINSDHFPIYVELQF